MVEVFEGIFLTTYTRQNGPIIIKMFPSNFCFKKEKECFLSCCFPENFKEKSFYCFSIQIGFCFVYAFTYNKNLYSIIFISKFRLPKLFLVFFRNFDLKMGEKTPKERFESINNITSKWKYKNSTNSIDVFFLENNFNFLIDSDQKNCVQFDPTVYIGNEKILNLAWHAIIRGKCILLVGETADDVTNAVFAAVSLLNPLIYIENILVYTGLGDSRFLDIINGSKQWKIVGTTNLIAAERCKQFEVIIKLPKKPLKGDSNACNNIFMKTNRISKRYLAKLDNRLEIDPYFDILGSSINENEMRHIIKGTDFNIDDIKLVINTNTFKGWRKSLFLREKFRESLLSSDINYIFRNRTKEELKELENVLKVLPERFPNDIHLKSVMHMHQKVIRKLLKE